MACSAYARSWTTSDDLQTLEAELGDPVRHILRVVADATEVTCRTPFSTAPRSSAASPHGATSSTRHRGHRPGSSLQRATALESERSPPSTSLRAYDGKALEAHAVIEELLDHKLRIEQGIERRGRSAGGSLPRILNAVC